MTNQRKILSCSLGQVRTGYEGQRYEVTAVDRESQERQVIGWIEDPTGGSLRTGTELWAKFVDGSVEVRDLKPEGEEAR